MLGIHVTLCGACVIIVDLLVLLPVTWCAGYRHLDRWEHVSVRFGYWRTLPQVQTLATQIGYKRRNDVCKTDSYHGFLFVKDGSRKARPIYDQNLNLAGVQFLIPGNLVGYNSQNETIRIPGNIGPPVLKSHTDRKGVLHYTVTAYFKHPSLICSPVIQPGVDPGRGLYIQTGFDPIAEHLHVPQHSRDLPPFWVPGNCRPQMGTHYFMNMSRNLPCEKIYPLFLMYDMEGKLGAFGWVFQGRPNNFQSEDGFHLTPVTYPLIFDTDMLPSCMFNENFKVFGIHVYLRNSTRLLCSRDLPTRPFPALGNVDENQGTIQILMHDNVQLGGNKSATGQSTGGDKNPAPGWIHRKPVQTFSDNSAAALRRDFSLTVLTCAILLFMTLGR